MTSSDTMQQFYDQHSLFLYFLMYVSYLILHSDIVHDRFFVNIPGATSGNYMTTYGTAIQGATFILTYILLMVIFSVIF